MVTMVAMVTTVTMVTMVTMVTIVTMVTYHILLQAPSTSGTHPQDIRSAARLVLNVLEVSHNHHGNHILDGMVSMLTRLFDL